MTPYYSDDSVTPASEQPCICTDKCEECQHVGQCRICKEGQE